MATAWKPANKVENNNPSNETTLSSWSRPQKIAVIASLVMLGLLLALSLGSKRPSKPAPVAVSTPAQTPASPVMAAPVTTTTATAPAVPKKVHKKRPAPIVTYSDSNSGVSFNYPRKFELASGDNAQPQFADLGAVPMNFVQPGGATVATVALPQGSYPGTDFTSAFFNVNVNRSLSEQECAQFAFVDTRNADSEPVEAETVKVGSKISVVYEVKNNKRVATSVKVVP